LKNGHRKREFIGNKLINYSSLFSSRYQHYSSVHCSILLCHLSDILVFSSIYKKINTNLNVHVSQKNCSAEQRKMSSWYE
ncbi:hypothetical protein ALC57_14697, partial [Trachymyrmex cornetzi]